MSAEMFYNNVSEVGTIPRRIVEDGNATVIEQL